MKQNISKLMLWSWIFLKWCYETEYVLQNWCYGAEHAPNLYYEEEYSKLMLETEYIPKLLLWCRILQNCCYDVEYYKTVVMM